MLRESWFLQCIYKLRKPFLSKWHNCSPREFAWQVRRVRAELNYLTATIHLRPIALLGFIWITTVAAVLHLHCKCTGCNPYPSERTTHNKLAMWPSWLTGSCSLISHVTALGILCVPVCPAGMCSSRSLCGNTSRSSGSEGTGSGAHYALCALGVGLIALGIVMIVWTVVPMDGEDSGATPTPPSNSTAGPDTKDSSQPSTVAMVLVGVGVAVLLLSILLCVRSRKKRGNATSQPAATADALLNHVAREPEEAWVTALLHFISSKDILLNSSQAKWIIMAINTKSKRWIHVWMTNPEPAQAQQQTFWQVDTKNNSNWMIMLL